MNLLEAKKMVDGYHDVVPEETARQLVLDPLSFFGKPSSKKLIPFPSNIEPSIRKYADNLKKAIAKNEEIEPYLLDLLGDFTEALVFNKDDLVSYAFGFMADFMSVCAEGDEEKIIEESLRSPYLILAIYECFIGKERDARESNLSCALFLMGLVNKYVSLAYEQDKELFDCCVIAFNSHHNTLLFTFSHHHHITQKRFANLLNLPSTLFYVRLEDRRKGNYKINLHLKKIDLIESKLQEMLFEKILSQIAMLPYFDKIDYMDIVEQIDNISINPTTVDLKEALELEEDGFSCIECWNLLLVYGLAFAAKDLSLMELSDAIMKHAEPYLEQLKNSGKKHARFFAQSITFSNNALEKAAKGNV